MPSKLKDVHPSPRFALRSRTANAHARLDGLYSSLDLASPGDYALFLTSHAAAFIPVEDALVAAGADAVMAGWSTHRRSAALRSDLTALGVPIPSPQISPSFADVHEVLGGLYVLEGSRLGGAILTRSVAAGQPTAFLNPPEAFPWRDFTALLDETLTVDAALERATSAATAVFTLFERSARIMLEPTRSAE